MSLPPHLESARQESRYRRDQHNNDTHWRLSLQIAVTYFLFSIIWIVVTDGLVWLEIPSGWFWISTGKGVLFISLTTMLIYWLCRRGFRLLERSNALLRAVVDTTSDCIYIKDRDGKYLLYNAAGANLINRSVEEVLGRDDKIIFEPESAQRMMAWDRRVMVAGQADYLEETLTIDGIKRTFASTKSPYRDPNGNVIGVVGITRDISEHRRIEDELRSSERRFRELANAIPQMVWTANPEGAVVQLNAKTFEYTGNDVDSLKGWSWESVIHPEDLTRVVENWKNIVQTGTPRDMEYRIRRFDGEYHWHLTRQVAVCDENGQIEAWYGTNTDIEDLKQAEANARQSTEVLRLVLDNIPQGVFWKDRNSRYLGCNRVVAKSKGFTHSDDVIGLGPADTPWITPKESAFFEMKDREVMETGVAQYHIIETMTCCDGSIIWLDTNKIPIRDADGQVTGLLGTWEDITERRLAEQTLKASEETLRLFMEHVAAPVAMFDREMRYVHASRRWYLDYQLAERDVVGKSHYEIFSKIPERWKVIHQRCLAGTIERADEDRFIRPDGTVQWLRWEMRPWMRANGEIGGVVIFSEDITERKQSELELRKLARLIEHSSDFIAMANLDGKITFMNSGGRKMIGLDDRDDISKLRFTDYVPEEWQDFLMNTVLPTARDQQKWEGEMQLRHLRTGEHIDVSRSTFLIQDDTSGDSWYATVTRNITASKKAESALRRSEEQLRLAIETANLGFYDWDLTTNQVYYSDRWKSQIGYEPEEITDSFQEFESRLHPDDHGPLMTKVSDYLVNPQPDCMAEFRLRHKDGSYRWIHTLSTFVYDESGKPIRMFGTHNDLTDQKRAASELESTRDRMAKTMESAPIVICSFALAPDGRAYMPYASAHLNSIFGLAPEDVAKDYTPAFDRMFDEDRLRLLETVRISAETMSPWRCEFRVRHPARGTIWVEGHSIPSEQPDGTILWHGYVADVTDRKRDDAALRETLQQLQQSEQRFRELANALPQTIWTSNDEGRLTFINMKAVEFTGQPVDQLLRLNWEGLIHPDDLSGAMDLWSRSIQEGIPYENELRFRRRDGVYRWQIVRVVPIRESSGAIREWYGTSADIDELKRVEQALRDRERFLRIVTDAAQVGLIVMNADYEVIFANEMYSKIVELELVQIIGKRVPDYNGGGWSQIKPHLDRVLLGERAEFEVVMPPVSGGTTPRTFRAVSEPQRDDSGHPTTVTVIVDITELNRSKHVLIESEKRYSRLVDVLPSAIMVHDTRKILFCNPAFAKLVGADRREDLIGLPPFQFADPEFYEAIRTRIASTDENGEPAAPVELRAIRLDGRAVSVEVVGVPIAGYSSKAYLAVLTDLTLRKEAEAKLHAEQERMAKTMEVAPIVICSFARHADGHSYMPFASPQFRNIHAMNPENVKENLTPAFNQIDPEDRSRIAETIEQSAQKMTPWRQEFRVNNPERGLIWVEGHSIPTPQQDGSILWHGYLADITDRKRDEEKLLANLEQLRISETRFRELADAIPETVWTADADGQLTHVNAKAIEFTGGSTEELMESNWTQIVHPDDLPRTIELWTKCVREGIPYENEVRFRRSDGEYHWQIIRALPIRDSSGQIREWYGMNTDVEKMKRVEQTLRDRERFLSIVTKTARIGITVVNHRYEYIFATEAYGEVLGLDTTEIIGRPIFEVLSAVWPQVKDKLDRVLAGELVDYEVTMPPTSRTTSERIFRVVSRPGTDDLGNPTSVAVVMDVTEISQSKKSIMESEERYRRLVELLPDAIFIHVDQRVTFCNSSCVKMFGASNPSQIIGKAVLELFHPNYHEIIRKRITTMLETKESAATIREIILRLDGSEIAVYVSASPITERGVTGILVCLHDVTEQERLEKQFQQSQKMEAVGRLAGGVAHDFNNLLTVINGYGNLILSELPQAAPHRESVMAILDAGERAARLTQQLLAFSRKSVAEPKVFDLNEQVEKITSMLRRVIEENIVLSVLLDPQLRHINAVPAQIEQLLMNMVVNARDAMPDGGRLMIETRNVTLDRTDTSANSDISPGEFVRLVISDTGHGMTDDVKNKIFEPFFTTKEVGKGTGLGLAVVHGVIKQSGGSIRVESTLGVGTTFTLLFPAVTPIASDVETESSRQSSPGHETILLVEDESAVRRIAKIALEANGYRVLEASGGKEALLYAEQIADTIHLLLTDVVMPEMGGQKLAEAMRKLRPHIRVLYMSGYTDESVLLHGVAQSTDELLRKPFTSVGLVRKVKSVLEQHL